MESIKEIALKVLRNMPPIERRSIGSYCLEFAEALIAEIQKQNKPVAWLSRESEGGRICLDVEDSGESGNWSPSFPVFIFPPSPEPQWQPIETAPKDAFVLLAGPSGYTTIKTVFATGRMCSDYHKGRWIDHTNDDLADWGFEPTHWMPLPEAPKGEQK